MTNLNELDLQNVTGGVTRITQNAPGEPSNSSSYKPVEDPIDSDAK